MKTTKAIYIILILILSSKLLLSQVPDYPLDISYYNFIDYSKNRFVFPADSSSFVDFFTRYKNLISKGEGKLRILHIGGSHIQADIYTAQTRYRLISFAPGSNAGRGFIFPYKMAKTNNPSNYKVKYSGDWNSCKIVKKPFCIWGLSGYNVFTSDSFATVNIKVYNKYRCDYSFDKIKVFHIVADSIKYAIDIPNSISKTTYPNLNYTEFILPEVSDTFQLNIQKLDTNSKAFILQGFSLETTDNIGLYYDAVGVNGAAIPSFLKEKLFVENLKVLMPDMVILSLGTNDAYKTNFNPQIYKANYDTLIQKILEVNPKTAILITVPNDDYYHKRYPNPNTKLQEKVIFDLAKKYNAGVWNLYDIMGRYGSSQVWYNQKLMRKDRIHFTHNGYILKGNLFFNAFVKFFDEIISTKKNILIKKDKKWQYH